MEGADRYCRAFKENVQLGRFFLVPSSHARGDTFHLYILPEGEKAIPNGRSNAPLNKDRVEVYGIISGQPGWTEKYGWLHKGKWVEDFEAIVTSVEIETNTKKLEQEAAEKSKESADQISTERLLYTY